MPKKRLPPLNALRGFEAAARHLSFRKASEELGVTHSAISHQIRLLEEHLGVRLFTRGAGGVSLSKQGGIYHPLIRAAFHQVEEATRLVVTPKAPGLLTLQVYSTFAIRWLIPRMLSFQSAHPDVRLRLHTSQSDANFEHEDVDLSVMIGQKLHSELHYDYLFSSRIFPVCSPSYLSRHGPLDDPSMMADLQILQVYPSEGDWQVWLREHGVADIDLGDQLQLDSYDLALNTAVQGMGIALGMEPFVNRDIKAGTLIELFPGKKVYTTGDWYLVSRSQRTGDKSFKCFREWLIGEVESDPSMQQKRQTPTF